MKYRNLITTISALCVSSLCLTSLAQGQQPSSDTNNSIYPVLADHFQMKSDFNKPQVQEALAWFKAHPTDITSLTKNATPYLYYVYQKTEKRNLPAELAILPMIESNYVPYETSNKGAGGLWQLMSQIASHMGIKVNSSYDGRRDLVRSTDVALDFLVKMNSRYHDWKLTMAAYNSGMGTVDKAIRYNKSHGLPTDYWSLSLPKETKQYVPKILALCEIVASSNHYNMNLNSIPNQPYLAVMETHESMQFNKVASLAGVSEKTVAQLNAANQSTSVVPTSSTLVLPKQNAKVFLANLAKQDGSSNAVSPVEA